MYKCIEFYDNNTLYESIALCNCIHLYDNIALYDSIARCKLQGVTVLDCVIILHYMIVLQCIILFISMVILNDMVVFHYVTALNSIIILHYGMILHYTTILDCICYYYCICYYFQGTCRVGPLKFDLLWCFLSIVLFYRIFSIFTYGTLIAVMTYVSCGLYYNKNRV